MAQRDEAAAGAARTWERAQEEARGIGDAVGRITSELRVLTERELELARAEMLDSKDAAKRAGIWGAVALVIAIQFVALAGFLALAQVLVAWAAALITAGVLLVLAGIGALVMRSALPDLSIMPGQTIRSLQEDMRWARERVQRNSA